MVGRDAIFGLPIHVLTEGPSRCYRPATGRSDAAGMSGPRNRKAFERSLHVRGEIRRAWLELHRRRPFARHSAKDVARVLPFPLHVDTISWHLRQLDAAEDTDSFRAAECSGDSHPS